MRYVTNSDGTVTDSKTGLMWKKDPESRMTWDEATSTVWPEFAGHTDWRVPTIEELLTLVDYSRFSPASEFPGMPKEPFWSASASAYFSSGAWNVHFNSGSAYSGYKANGYRVRLVRAGQSLESLRAEIAALREERDAAFGRGMREAGKRIFGDREET